MHDTKLPLSRRNRGPARVLLPWVRLSFPIARGILLAVCCLAGGRLRGSAAVERGVLAPALLMPVLVAVSMLCFGVWLWDALPPRRSPPRSPVRTE
jgi:hypothetical protein